MMNGLAEGTFQGLHPDEVALFRTVLKGVKGIGVEIGCLDGYSSRIILEASELHLTSIDPFIPDSMEASLIGSKEKYLHNAAPFGDRSTLVEGYSHEYREHIEKVSGNAVNTWTLDFLFIDGDHTYPAVLQDFNDWTPLLHQEGLLAMHDARMYRDGGANYHPGPSQVAKEMIFGRPDEWDIVDEAHSLVIARKR